MSTQYFFADVWIWKVEIMGMNYENWSFGRFATCCLLRSSSLSERLRFTVSSYSLSSFFFLSAHKIAFKEGLSFNWRAVFLIASKSSLAVFDSVWITYTSNSSRSVAFSILNIWWYAILDQSISVKSLFSLFHFFASSRVHFLYTFSHSARVIETRSLGIVTFSIRWN